MVELGLGCWEAGWTRRVSCGCRRSSRDCSDRTDVFGFVWRQLLGPGNGVLGGRLLLDFNHVFDVAADGDVFAWRLVELT